MYPRGRVVRTLVLMFLVLTLALPSAFAEDGAGTGDGGGTKVPTLTGISVGSITDSSAVAVFTYTNNIGAKGSYNTQFFYAQDAAGVPVSFTVKYWPDPSDVRKREFELRLSGLSPSSTYVVGVKAGVTANNGLVSPSTGTRSFTTAQATVPVVPPPAKPPANDPAVTPPTQGGTGGGPSTGSGAGTITSPSTPDAAGGNIPAWSGSDVSVSVAVSGEGTETISNPPGSGGGEGGGKDEPLALVESDPRDGSYGVDLDAEIELKFSKNVVYLGVRDANRQAFSLWSGDERIDAEIVMVDDQIEFDRRNYVVVRPSEPLERATTYVVRVDDTLESKSGAVLESPVEVEFHTVGYVPPFVYAAIAAALVMAGVGGWYLVIRRRSAPVDGPDFPEGTDTEHDADE